MKQMQQPEFLGLACNYRLVWSENEFDLSGAVRVVMSCLLFAGFFLAFFD